MLLQPEVIMAKAKDDKAKAPIDEPKEGTAGPSEYDIMKESRGVVIKNPDPVVPPTPTTTEAQRQVVRDPLSTTLLTGRERMPTVAPSGAGDAEKMVAEAVNLLEKMVAGGVVAPWAFLAHTEIEDYIHRGKKLLTPITTPTNG